MFKHINASLMVLLLLTPGFDGAAARDEIRIVGSPAVLPITQTVAENFSNTWGLTAPSLEFTGTGNGFRLFCKGIGYEHPDINATPRQITETELATCRANGVTDITEIAVGVDAIAVVNSTAVRQYNFDIPQLFKAMASKVPLNGKIVKNPYTKWSQIDTALPAQAIFVMGPSLQSAASDKFIELIMRSGCESFAHVAKLDDAERFKVCHTIRKDGAFVEGPSDEPKMIGWLQQNPQAFGIASLSLLLNHPEVIAGNSINRVRPTLENVASQRYPLCQPIYLYVKTKHVAAIKGLQQFLYEATSERAIGPDGYLADKDFIALDDIGRNHARDRAISLTTLSE